MTEENVKVESKEENKPISGSKEEIFNEPEILYYISEAGEKKKIEIRRLSAFSLDQAIIPILSLIPCIDFKTKTFDAFSMIATNTHKTLMKDIREVLVTCINITSEELGKVDLETYGKLVASFLKINLSEIERFTKTFLGIKKELEKYATMMTK